MKELKNRMLNCIIKLLNEEVENTDDNISSDPRIQNAHKKVEVSKQELERQKQRDLSNRIRIAQVKRRTATDLKAREIINKEIKDLVDQKKASVAALNAARISANSIK